jgi:urease accessory protein
VGARTVVRQALASSPLRLLTPRNHGEGAWVFTSTFGGGLVDGDRISLDIDLAAGARAWVGSQGANRVYRSPRGCKSELKARVAEGALLVVAPDPTACFADASYEQRTALDLEAGASVALLDTLTAGRSARGERWAFKRCLSSLSLRVGGSALLDEAWLLDPAQGAIAERLGRFDALATVLLAGPLFAEARAKAKAQIDAAPPRRGARVIEAASPLGADALLIRIAAASVEEATRASRAHLAAVPALLGDDPWARRF